MNRFRVRLAIIAALASAAPAAAQTMYGTQAAGVRVGGVVVLKCDGGGAGPVNCRAITASDPLPMAPAGSTPTQLSGTVATSGGTVALPFTATSDSEFVNPSASTFWCSWGTPAVNGAGSYPIAASGSYRPPNRVAGTFTCLSTAASQPYTFTRF